MNKRNHIGEERETSLFWIIENRDKRVDIW